MTLNNKEVISVLNDLIETCKDGQTGFKEAAASLQDTHIRSLFTQLGLERGAMAGDLQQEVQRLGGNPEKNGSAAGAVHRGWIDVKSTVTGKDDEAIVAEAERGEDFAKNAYQKAMQTALPTDLRKIIQTQYTRVIASHDSVRALERTISH